MDSRELKSLCDKLCSACHVCQAVKPSYANYGTLDYCPVPTQIFCSLCMDFLSLPKFKSEDGEEYDVVFVIVDRLSGYILAIPCNKTGLTAEKTA